MYSYEKYKECSPEETVRKIQGILNHIGLISSVEWTKNEYEGAYSNRVTLYPTSLGSNGKGTDAMYALASGFAELMERIENGMLVAMRESQELAEAYGFFVAPDEKKLPVENIIKQDDYVTNYMFQQFRKEHFEDRIKLLRELSYYTEGCFEESRCIPFADFHANRIVYLPVHLLLYFYGTNGMAAGNTMEEALVQGLSEIFERYVNKAVIRGVVPPEIPREFVDNFQISGLIRDIEKDPRYRVSFFDCSLGRGFPACAMIIRNVQQGTFGIKFACHPSFQVALERTLTEAFQGKRLEEFTRMNRIGNNDQCITNDNIPNVAKVGVGCYPASLFAGKPSYEFQPRTEWNGLSNREMLVKMFQLVDREGFHVLIRDASHLGFPAFYIVIPGMSELYEFKYLRLRELRTSGHILESLRRFPNLTPEEKDRLMLMVLYKQDSTQENTFSRISLLPIIGKELNINRFRAILHLRRGEYMESSWLYQSLAQNETSEAQKERYFCASEYARLTGLGVLSKDITATLQKLFRAEIADYVVDVLSDPENAMEKVFQPLPCHHCEICKYAEWECEYPNIQSVMKKIKAGLADSKVSQQSFIKQLAMLSE